MSQDIELRDQEPPITTTSSLLPVTRTRQITILISSFLTCALTIGVNQAYGVFLDYYINPAVSSREQFLPQAQAENKALVAFVGTLGAGLTWAGSIVVNPMMASLSKRGVSFKPITIAGAVLLSLGYLLAGSCSQVFSPFDTPLPCLNLYQSACRSTSFSSPKDSCTASAAPCSTSPS